ncbi:MAG: hypothetical protein PQJ50_07260, partial [Spirochaetales bacterium]|nr:hypothetical protein [Spirochaetales bacterium]
MKNRTNYIVILLALTALIFAGCSSDAEDTSGEDYLMAGYYMLAGEETALTDDSKATAPVFEGDFSDLSFPDYWVGTTRKINNYPEQGQKTYVTVSQYDTDVYFISSKTEYPKKEEILDYYLEEYYIQDEGDEFWDGDDAVVDPDDLAGSEGDYFRETMEVVFQDGSVRKEWIAEIPDAADRYDAFDIDDEMAIPDDESFITSTANDQSWSSKVYYYQKVETSLGYFDDNNIEIFGVRYYTELADGSSSTLVFEKVLSREDATLDTSTSPD